jgi:hypothetical protein
VRQSSGRFIQLILVAVDGLAAYPKVVKKLFATKDRSNRGRPRNILWPKLNIVQVIKRYNGNRLSHIERRVAHGDWGTVSRLLVQTHEPDKLCYLGEAGLKPGVDIRLLSRGPFNGPLRIGMSSQEHEWGHEWGHELASMIRVEAQN